MALSDYVNTFGQAMLQRYGERVHKLALHAGFTCPNRDGSKGRGGCTFCNNASFNPAGRRPATIAAQLADGRRVIGGLSKARLFLAYFQAYTNTYAPREVLAALYDQALAVPDVIGLAVGTRPDCVPDTVLDLLADYRSGGLEVWLELGLQSACEETLARVRRGHGLAEYRHAVRAARARGIPVCTHLIAGLPGETAAHCRRSLDIVLELGVDGLKLHPLHVVRGTQLAREWRRGDYRPLALDEYVDIAADLVQRTPAQVVFHRLTGTAPAPLLLAPDWCAGKWRVLNGIERELQRRGRGQLVPPAMMKEEAQRAI
ncbi:MAG: TIGR01212 family radical SAM protein [Pseudomonadota bacterium]